MVKLKLCERFSRNFFFKASGLALISAITLFSCNDENPIAETNETNDYLLDEYAFFDPSDTLNITACEAEDIATAFMDEIGGIDNTFKSKGMRYSCRKTTVIPDDNREPALYAINLDPDGFCIVAATKKTETILAYSDQGKFDINNLPIGLADWISEKIEIIQDVRSDADITIPKNPKWSTHHLCAPSGRVITDGSSSIYGYAYGSSTTTSTYGPLLKTNWGQGYPYNYECPEWCPENNGHKLAGCVAIAAAQVVRYWKPSSVSYSWDDMPNSASSSTPTSYVKSNKGYSSMTHLISELGVALHMEYGCENTGSGAMTRDIPEVLSQKYKFYNNGKYEVMETSQAEAKIISNIKNKQPVIMNGKSGVRIGNDVYPTGGHAWVCDGYKEVRENQKITQQLFHMNWGWDGINNGWFTLDLKFVKGDNSSTGSDGNYIYLRGYITDIKARN